MEAKPREMDELEKICYQFYEKNYEKLDDVDHQIYIVTTGSQSTENSSENQPYYLISHFENKEKERRLIKMLTKVNHLNIENYIGFFVHDKMTYLVSRSKYRFEFLERVMGCFKYSYQAIQNVVYQILKGLSHIHKRRIIHRDIKPMKIIINARGIVKIMRFSEAKESLPNDANVTTVGTYQYISPEILQRHPHNYKTDVWSLGAIAYKMYYGYPLYQVGLNDFVTANNIFVSLEAYFGDTSPKMGFENNFKNFLKKCLQIDPEKRASAQELLRDDWLIISAVDEKKREIFKKLRKFLVKAETKIREQSGKPG